MKTRGYLAGATLAGAMMFGTISPALAQQSAKQDGLVNVVVGDVTILEDVNVAVAAPIAAQICGVDVGVVAAVIAAVDNSSRTAVLCRQDDGDKVRFVQN